MASSIVLPAAKLIGNSLVDEVKYLYAVKSKVESLHDELVWMGCFLKDVDANQHDEMVNLWVSRITDFAGDAEDIVENYLHKVSRQRQDGIWSTLKWFSCICCDGNALHQVGSDIDRLKDSIADLSSRMHTYGVKTQSLGGGGTSRPRILCEKIKRSLYDFDDKDVVGSTGDVDKVVGILAADSGPRVVSIAGPVDGSGKTTLAQLAFKARRVDAYFGSKAWVYVKRKFQTRSVMEEILEKLECVDAGDRDRTKAGHLQDDELVSRICQVLTERKCLVVLDGILFDTDWAKLAPAFATMTRSQSKLLITTRNTRLLSYVDCEGLTVNVNWGSSLDEIWKTLDKSDILPDHSSERDAMETLGEVIFKYCCYKPSLIGLLIAILSTKKTLAEFEEVYNNMRIYCAYPGAEFAILELCYYDLPYYLKPCFLHLGNFPDNMEIPIAKVCRLWAIEGIVAQPTGSAARQAPAEAIAEAYLAELASRKLVQLGSTGDNESYGSCRLHSLVRDMCRRKSKEENFLDVIEQRDFLVQTSAPSNSASLKNQKLRRLAIYVHKDGNRLHQLISDRNTQHVRTLMLFPTEEGIPFHWAQGTMSEFLKLVRVLDFEGVCISSLPSEIGDLIHLRYLNLKGTSVSSLPSSIGRLKFIKLLDLRVQECIEMIIPNVIWKLERLRNLYLPNRWRVGVSRSLMSITRAAAEKTSKLRLRGLSQLETVMNLRLEECMVEDLKELEKLNNVSLADYVVKETEGLRSFLSNLVAASHLRKLILVMRVDGGVLNEDPSILISPMPPLIFHHKIELSGKLVIKLDFATTFPPHLNVLILEGCELEDDPMPILEKLRMLKELTLGANSYVGTEMVCTAGNFRRLYTLRLVQLKNLLEWKMEETAMERLGKLFIYSCDRLTKIPAELPRSIKIGCRPCVMGTERYGCCFTTNDDGGA